MGMWNTIGYNNRPGGTGGNYKGQYASKDAVQMRGIFNMINHMTGGAL